MQLLMAEELVVVVSKESKVTKLNKNDIERIFLAKTKRFPNGDRVIAVENKNVNNHKDFYSAISNKSITQLRSYWAKLVFSGKGKPPIQINEDKLIKYIEKNPNAITYISKNSTKDTLKIVYRVK